MRVGHEAYAFRIRQQFGLPTLLCVSHRAPADELVQQMTHHYKVHRHDGVVDAVLLAALDSNLAMCREVAKHIQRPFGELITPDGAIVLADGTVIDKRLTGLLAALDNDAGATGGNMRHEKNQPRSCTPRLVARWISVLHT